MPEETAIATVGIIGMKDIVLEEESKQELELASKNPSDIMSLDDAKYSNKTEAEETETVESVDLKKVNTEEPVTDDKVSENEVSPVDEIQFDTDHSSKSTEDEQVDVKSEASDVIKEDDISSIDGETATLPKQEVSTDESKKLETEQTSHETHMPIDHVDESSEDEEIFNVDITSIEKKNLPVDHGIEEEIPLTEIVASTIMNPKESSSSFVIEEISDKSEAVIEGSELTLDEENHVQKTEPGSTLVAAKVEEQENVSSDEDPEVQSSEAEQISDLEVISVEESIVPVPQTAPEMSFEASVDEVTKLAEEEQLAEKASFAESEKLMGPPQVVSPPDQIKTEALVKTSTEALVIDGSSKVPALKVSSEAPALKLSSEELVVKASSECLAVQVSSEDPAVEVSSENSMVKVSSEDPAVKVSSEAPVFEAISDTLVVEVSSEDLAVKVSNEEPAVEISNESEATQFMEPKNTQ